MRNLILGLSLSVAFIVGCMAGPVLLPKTSAAPVLLVPPARSGAVVRKWEYFCFTSKFGKVADLESKATKAGKHGWEMAAVAVPGGNVGEEETWCFKRRLLK